MIFVLKTEIKPEGRDGNPNPDLSANLWNILNLDKTYSEFTMW